MPDDASQRRSAESEGRRCFVTVGATASFIKLLRAVLDPTFLDGLARRGFSELVVQTGPDHDWAVQQIESLGAASETATTRHHPPWPSIEAVRYTTDVPSLMLPCRGEARRRRPGAMISHAGSGSILDAVRCDVPLVVVPNPDLLGNHQEELADAVRDAGWAVKGDLEHLEDAVAQVLQTTDHVPVDSIQPYQEPPFPTAEAERSGLFEWAALYGSQDPRTATADSNLLHLD